MENEANKNELRRIVKIELDSQMNLKDIYRVIEEEVGKKVTSIIDKEFIENEYITICKEFLNNEVRDYVKKLNQNDVRKTLTSLRDISTLSEFREFFQGLHYYNLLMKHIALVSKEDNANFTILLKNTCRDQIHLVMGNAINELQFLKSFIDFMSRTYCLPYVLSTTQLSAFCNGKLQFEELARNILKCGISDPSPRWGNLCDSTRVLIKHCSTNNQLFFLDLIKQELNPYAKPIKIQEVEQNDGVVLRISGMNIVLTNVKDEIEKKLKDNPQIEGVNIVSDRIFHIDDNLSDQSIWHGKNVTCVAKVIDVRKSGLEWNVSGRDNLHAYTEDCGKQSTGDGKNGSDGFAGESGGNISILVEEIIDANYLTITSNGGDGSKGQDGGNGEIGADGNSISFNCFKDRYPNTCDFWNCMSDKKYFSNIDTLRNDCHKIDIWCIESNRDTFIQGVTINGNQITYSDCPNRWFSVNQGFLLYKGSCGKSGRSGGQAGLGGAGGYAGEISIQFLNHESSSSSSNNICTQRAKQGENGEDGKGGLYGTFGKNGWDMAWMDYAGPGWPKYYGKDENSTLKVEFYYENSSSRVICPYKENSAYKYASIKASSLEHAKMKKFEERQSSKRQRTELQQQAQAVRQKAILGQSMKAEFSRLQQNDTKSTIANLQSEVESLQDAALQDIVTTEKQELTQSYDVKVTRSTRFEAKKNPRQRKKFLNTKTIVYNKDNNNPLWELEKIENALNSKDHVGSIGELSTQNYTEILTKLEMCYLFLFRQIDKALPLYYSHAQSHSMIVLTAGSASRFLVKANENISQSITHRTLGTLHQYLRSDEPTQRQNIAKFCKQIQKTSQSKKILYSLIRDFVLEAGNAELAHSDLKKFHKLYNFHLMQKKKGLIAFPDAIDEYCVENDNVYKSFMKYLVDNGCESRIYLNLLANIFEINIRVYIELESNDLELYLNLNPSAKMILYLTHMFERLTLNDAIQQLIAERQRKCLQYRKIMMDVQNFHTSSQFHNYLADGNFVNKNRYSEDEFEEFYQQNYSNEADAIKDIAENFPQNCEIEKRLPMLKFHLSGQRGILYFLSKHFAHEAIRVSSSELKYIINYALNYAAENGQNGTDLFLTWIIAAHNQENWIDEVILLELEEFFGEQLPNKLKWRGFLSKLGNKNILICFGQQLARSKRSSLTKKCVEEILDLLSKMPNQEINVNELELVQWPYVLRSVFWTFTLSKIAHWANDEELEKLCYYVEIIKNIFGENFTSKLLTALKEKGDCQRDVIFMSKKGLLIHLMSKISSQNWMITDKHLEQLKAISLKAWFQQMTKTFAEGTNDRSLKELTNIIQRNANTSESIKELVPQVEKAITIPDYGHAKQLERIDEVILMKRKYRLRNTQKLAVLLLLKNEHSTLAQVSTGEGKTLIVVTAALIKALCGEKVDIVTSSSVLAKRDAEINSDIYKHFKVEVSHNCNEEIEQRKTAYSSKVIYGELSNFQRDYLLDHFYGKNILGKRNFNQVNVIVDEVDSMLLDKGNNMLYLSHDLPGMDKLESVYIFIWSWVCKPANPVECFNAPAIREAVLRDLYGLITVADIGQIDPKLSKLQISDLWNSLINGNIIDKMGKVKVYEIDEDKIQNILSSSEYLIYGSRLVYLITSCLQRQRRIYLPNYLRDFVERHLDRWIQSAFYAFFMADGVDYVVDVDRTGAASSSRSPQIIILDKGTGTDQTSSQWDEGLHQFLQLKHNCKVTLQSLKAVFTSNVSFFKLYKNLYGLTGTLGSEVERNILTQMHGVDFFTVPTAKVKQLEEFPPVVCPNSTEWAKRIHNETKNLTEFGRSVLIIAETVKDAEDLFNTIGGKALLYTREYNEFDLVKGTKDLAKGEIIIATNLAGRGTDIKVSNELSQAGGLHVILSYLPSNVRIEEQAFGRTARCGEKGTAQLIIIDPNSKSDPVTGAKRRSNIFRLKNERNEEEVRRLSEVKLYYENQILLEEDCFQEFHKTYLNLKRYSSASFTLRLAEMIISKDMLNDFKTKFTDNEVEKSTDAELSAILMDAVLEKWAFWLDSNSKLIQNCASEMSRKQVLRKLTEFISNLKDLNTSISFSDAYSSGKLLNKVGDFITDSEKYKNAAAWVRDSPIQTVKLALHFANKMNWGAYAIQLFDQVIKMEPHFCDSAHYYKAFALIKCGKINEFQKELQAAMRILNQHSVNAQISGAIVDTLKFKNTDSILQIDAYKQQQAALAHIYELIIDSIQGIFGYPITVKSISDANIPIDRAFDIFNTLIIKDVLTKPKIGSFEAERVKKIATEYGANELNDFLLKWQNSQFKSEAYFKELLKKSIILPSRGHFFQNLIHQKVLKNGTKLVSFEMQNIKSLHSGIGETVENLFSTNQLTKVNVSPDNVWLSGIEPNSEHILVDRQSFKAAIGRKWYSILKHTNSLSFHYRAKVDENRMDSVQFSHFDSLCISDFKNVNIGEPDALKIIQGLVKNGIIVQRRHGSSEYGLKESFEYMSDAKLVPDYPVYENATHNLLRQRFCYRDELERLRSQLADKSYAIKLGLLSKPHNNLIMDLIQDGILVPTKVSDKSLKQIEGILDILFPKPQYYHRALYAIQHTTDLRLSNVEFPDKNINTSIFNLLSTSKAISETLESPDGSLKPLSEMSTKENFGMAEEVYLIPLYGFKQLVELAERIDLRLSNVFPDKNINTSIFNLLSTSKAISETLESPDGSLKPLSEMSTKENFGMAEEFYRFSLNGFKQLVELAERKWTTAFFIRSTLVTVIGISQIALGAVLQLFPIFGNVAGTFCLEQGIGDLMFAISSVFSGCLTWGDYRQHKIFNAAISAVTCGIGAWFTGSSNVSVYGQKLVGPGLMQSGKEVSKMTGKQLINVVGKKTVAKAVVMDIVKSAGMGIANGVSSCSVNYVIETYLRDFFNQVFSVVAVACSAEIDKKEASDIFKNIHKRNGAKNGMQFLQTTTTVFFTHQTNNIEFYRKTNQTIETLRESFLSIAQQRKQEDHTRYLKIAKAAIFALEKGIIIALINFMTQSFLKHLKSECEKQSKSKGEVAKASNDSSVKFLKEAGDKTKEMLQKEMKKIFFEKVAAPVVAMGLNILKDSAVNYVCDMYQKYNDRKDNDEFQKAKKEFNSEKEKQLGKTEYDLLEKTYHEKLLKLMRNTRSPEVVAEIVKEGVPIDMTCVTAAAYVISKAMNCSVNIVVDAHDELQQEVNSVCPENRKALTICISLNENHYMTGPADDESSYNQSKQKNDCLYQSLPNEFREQMTSDEFRNKIANEITNNEIIIDNIKHGYHRVPFDLDLYGGRKAVRSVRDEESTEQDAQGNLRYENKYVLKRDKKTGKLVEEHPTSRETHLYDRFYRVEYLTDKLIEISKTTGIPIDKIIISGASQSQDGHSTDKNYHNCHVFRCGIHPELERYPEIKKQVEELLGHTQLANRDVNYGVGRQIDKLQSEWIPKILQAGGSREAFNSYRDSYCNILNRAQKLPFYRNKPKVLEAIQIAEHRVRTHNFEGSKNNRRNSMNI